MAGEHLQRVAANWKDREAGRMRTGAAVRFVAAEPETVPGFLANGWPWRFCVKAGSENHFDSMGCHFS
jgi:hypothetical protein